MSYFNSLSIISLTAIFAVPLLLSEPAAAQMSANPTEVAAKIREMGPRLGREVVQTTRRLYAPLQAAAPREGVKVTRDQVYGPHERHRLDVFQPAKKSARSAPVVVYLHGGGFVRGDKRGVANVGTYFARHGVIGITINYRLAPASKWPAGAQDIGNVIKWIKRNAAKLGGDANKIILMGSSAGAGHVASYVFFEDQHVKDDGVVGAILVSGPTYQLTPGRRNHFPYFGEDAAKYDAMSSIKNIDGRKIPLFITYAELDMPPIHRQNMLLIDAVFKRDKMLPVVKQAQGHNHISITAHINTKDKTLGPDMLEFIRAR